MKPTSSMDKELQRLTDAESISGSCEGLDLGDNLWAVSGGNDFLSSTSRQRNSASASPPSTHTLPNVAAGSASAAVPRKSSNPTKAGRKSGGKHTTGLRSAAVVSESNLKSRPGKQQQEMGTTRKPEQVRQAPMVGTVSPTSSLSDESSMISKISNFSDGMSIDEQSGAMVQPFKSQLNATRRPADNNMNVSLSSSDCELSDLKSFDTRQHQQGGAGELSRGQDGAGKQDVLTLTLSSISDTSSTGSTPHTGRDVGIPIAPRPTVSHAMHGGRDPTTMNQYDDDLCLKKPSRGSTGRGCTAEQFDDGDCWDKPQPLFGSTKKSRANDGELEWDSVSKGKKDPPSVPPSATGADGARESSGRAGKTVIVSTPPVLVPISQTQASAPPSATPYTEPQASAPPSAIPYTEPQASAPPSATPYTEPQASAPPSATPYTTEPQPSAPPSATPYSPPPPSQEPKAGTPVIMISPPPSMLAKNRASPTPAEPAAGGRAATPSASAPPPAPMMEPAAASPSPSPSAVQERKDKDERSATSARSDGEVSATHHNRGKQEVKEGSPPMRDDVIGGERKAKTMVCC